MSRDEWWLDYVEGELDPVTRAEMKSLLRSSQKDQDLVKALSDTKYLLQESGDPLPEFSNSYLDSLHDKIMCQVETLEMRKKPPLELTRETKEGLKTAGVGLGLVLLFLFASRWVTFEGFNPQWDLPFQMAIHGQKDPDQLAQLMSYQTESDFFVDVASHSLDHLTKEQFESLLQSGERTR
jgi:hypothetical protein